MFTDCSKAVLLLWIIYFISVLFCYAFMHVCLLMPCGHLLGKGWPLGFRLWCLIVMLSLSHWYPGSGVELDCIDSWYLPSFLLCIKWIKIIKCHRLKWKMSLQSTIRWHIYYRHFFLYKVSKGANIRNRYNQVRHLTQDTNGKVTNSQLDTINESQEVSPLPAGDHKAQINRHVQRQETQERKNIKDQQKKHRLGTFSKIFYWSA